MCGFPHIINAYLTTKNKFGLKRIYILCLSNFVLSVE